MFTGYNVNLNQRRLHEDFVVFCCISAQKKLENEVTERDKKYAELDAKLGKLQKRAKQRIQELQKVSKTLPTVMVDIWTFSTTALYNAPWCVVSLEYLQCLVSLCR
jgi:hypothetical protein